MIVQDLVAKLGLQVHSPGNVEREVTGGYASDLLSCVMAGAKAGNVWVTLQAHPNVVAVASLLDLAAAARLPASSCTLRACRTHFAVASPWSWWW